MNEKTSDTSDSSPASRASSLACEKSGNDRTVLDFLSDLSRQQLAVLTQSTSALYRGSENLRKIQQDTAHQASVRHGEAAQKLFGHCQPADLLPIQSELLRSDLQSAGEYWQQLMVAAMQTQRELMTSMSRMLDGEKDGGLKLPLDVFQAAIPALASSFFVAGSNRQTLQQQDS